MSYEINQKQAEAFAQMLLSGISPTIAVRYFFPEGTDDKTLESAAKHWPTRKIVTEALDKFQGKNWLDMEPMERIEKALQKHYNEAAFFLTANNYAEADGPKLKKMDACREMLEKKLAGNAGTEDPLVKLYQDILAGKVPAPGNVPRKDLGPAVRKES